MERERAVELVRARCRITCSSDWALSLQWRPEPAATFRGVMLVSTVCACGVLVSPWFPGLYERLGFLVVIGVAAVVLCLVWSGLTYARYVGAPFRSKVYRRALRSLEIRGESVSDRHSGGRASTVRVDGQPFDVGDAELAVIVTVDERGLVAGEESAVESLFERLAGGEGEAVRDNVRLQPTLLLGSVAYELGHFGVGRFAVGSQRTVGRDTAQALGDLVASALMGAQTTVTNVYVVARLPRAIVATALARVAAMVGLGYGCIKAQSLSACAACLGAFLVCDIVCVELEACAYAVMRASIIKDGWAKYADERRARGAVGYRDMVQAGRGIAATDRAAGGGAWWHGRRWHVGVVVLVTALIAALYGPWVARALCALVQQ